MEITSDRGFDSLASFLFGRRSRRTKRVWHLHDFGDYWMHDVVVEKVREGEAGAEIPALVDGARRLPSEDVGVAGGFMGFPEAVFGPFHTEHTETIGWHGGPFDPDDMDERRARMRLGTWRSAAGDRLRAVGAVGARRGCVPEVARNPRHRRHSDGVRARSSETACS